MRILQLITSLAYGGAETHLLLLSRALKERGHEVVVISMTSPEALAKEFESNGIDVYSLGMQRGCPSLFALLKLRRIVREFRPDVVHSHMVHANLMARVLRMIISIPRLICTAHNVNEGACWREIAYRLTDPLCDFTTNVSQAAVDRYINIKAVPADKIMHIPNGIDLKKFTGPRHSKLDKDCFKWLAVGRFVPAKDYESMLRAYRLVLDTTPHVHLSIVGDGPLRKTVEALATELNISESIEFLGIRSDIRELMLAADSYVMSSRWEGLPMVLLEAAAARLPIVATDVGGNREVVVHDVNGFLVIPEDPKALADGMLKLMHTSEENRGDMGNRGFKCLELTYDINLTVEAWLQLYNISPVNRVRVSSMLGRS